MIDNEAKATIPETRLPGIPTEPQPAKKPQKTRRDKGTARLVVPKGLAKQLAADAQAAGLSVPELLLDWRDLANRPVEDVPQLPEAVLSLLRPAAEATGRSMTDLLAEYEGPFLNLLRGQLAHQREGGETDLDIPSLADHLVERFRAKLEGR